jgi:ribosomal protein S18 acetylase RimI-like enzyme
VKRTPSPLIATEIRLARAADAPDIAKLHAASWRRHYRGAYSDHYLDGDLDAERLAAWTERMNARDAEYVTLLADHQDRPVGFVHVVLDSDPTWGALIDNLHVSHSVQRSGIGTLLLDRAVRIVMERRPDCGIYLWVLEQNRQAQAFYLSRGGTLCHRELAAPPRGDPRNLNGAPRKIRVVWSDAASLLASNISA